jgi:hypothetical protein
MHLTHDQALSHLHAWVKSESLLKHARALEIVMRAAAKKYGEPNARCRAMGVSFRQACMNRMGVCGIVGCRHTGLWRTADGDQEDT